MLLVLIVSIILVVIGAGLYILACVNCEKTWSVIPLLFSFPIFVLGIITLTNTVIIICAQQ